MPMNCGQLQSTELLNVQLVPVEPEVKSAKTCNLSLRGVTAFPKIGKTTDPTCYDAAVINKESDMQQYPVGGPRQPVYDLMRGLGFSMAKFSDKTWTSADGMTVHIYGAGSMARLSVADAHQGEFILDDLSQQVDCIRRHFNRA